MKHFNYFGFELSLDGEPDFDKKINRYQGKCSSIRKKLNKTRKDKQMVFFSCTTKVVLRLATCGVLNVRAVHREQD